MINFAEVLIWLGLAGTSEATRRRLISKLNELLEYRVGGRLAFTMPNELTHLFGDDADPEVALSVLNRYIPDYKTIVQEELDILISDFWTSYELKTGTRRADIMGTMELR